jgi:hypothetical protein
LIEKFLDPAVNLSPDPVLNADGSIRQHGLDNHAMGTIFEEWEMSAKMKHDTRLVSKAFGTYATSSNFHHLRDTTGVSPPRRSPRRLPYRSSAAARMP